MSYRIICADIFEGLKQVEDHSVHCVITSPPYYGLRCYGIPPREWSDGTTSVFGEEDCLERYIAHSVEVFRELKRILHPRALFFLNIADCYAGGGKHVEPKAIYNIPLDGKPTRKRQKGLTGKDLLMVPARIALALQADGWILRQDIVWAKALSFCPHYSGSVMPESTRDRCTWAYEHIFQFAINEDYFYDQDGCREPYAQSSKRDAHRHYNGISNAAYEPAKAQNPSNTKRRVQQSILNGVGRNLRNVWVIPKQNLAGGTIVSWRLLSEYEPSHDIYRKVSPNCPVHGDLPASLAMGQHDVHASHLCYGSGCIDDYRAQEPFAVGVPSEQNRVTPPSLDIADSQNRLSSPSATDRSTETHRMGRVPATCVPDTPYTQKHGRTACIFEQSDVDGPTQNISENNILDEVYQDDRYFSEVLDHNKHTLWLSACCCRYYHKVIQESRHFAAFPEALVRPIIQLATSEKGCCPHCGEPVRRKTIREPVPADVQAAFNAARVTSAETSGRTDGHTRRKPNYRRRVLRTEWEVGCECPGFTIEAAVPCRVLDCFSGSGRAGIVAVGLGRDFTGIDASSNYCELASAGIEAAYRANR